VTNLFRHSKGITGYFVAFIGVVFMTLLLSLFHLHVNDTTISLALLIVVLVVATIFGSRPALFASILGLLCFNFFFLPPVYTFTIAEPQKWVGFAAFLVTALIAGQLSSYARRRAEESEQRRQEIERLYNELQSAFEQASQAEALRRSEQLKSSLLDAVTHDLRTPLTSIKASVTTLIEDRNTNANSNGNSLQLDDEGRGEFLEIINEETDRLNQFIEGMVGLAKIEAGALHLRKSLSQVEEIINNAIDRAKNRLSGHEVSVEIERDLPAIFVDASSISEVVYTLLDNAAKYSPENSKIRIETRRDRRENIEISVEDEGKGISNEMREKVFGKFFRASGSDIHTTSSGLGLGLAIARGIIESQGGKIWLEDGRDGFVTRAVFTVPLGDDKN
jgi:K+-sensing histidine kinase KdpD